MREGMQQQQQQHIVLVHGLSHGAWCWYKVRSLLEESGDYKVTCLDLKGSGIDPTDPNTVLTWQDYNQPLIRFFQNLPDHEKVVLVGHSAGGLSVTYSTHLFCEKIAVAIYVAGPMLRNGFATEEDIKQGSPNFAEYGDVSDDVYGLCTDQPATSFRLKDEFQRPLLYHMSPVEDSTLASMLIRPGPARPSQGAVFNGDGADGVPRVYIKTLHDRMCKVENQDLMISRSKPCTVYEVESEHSPFFSAPSVLSGFIAQATRSIFL